MWKNTGAAAKELFFPKRCFFCKDYGRLLCDDCQALAEISPGHRPDRSQKYLIDIYSACSYENNYAKKLVCGLKYKPFCQELALPIAEMIAGHFKLAGEINNFNASVIVWVPLAPKRIRWRGFNQSQVIAQNLARLWQIPAADCLIRTRETKNQAELSEAARRENIKGAFACVDSSPIKNKTVFLVDDVITTGATMSECARVLLKNGARKIIGASFARAENP